MSLRDAQAKTNHRNGLRLALGLAAGLVAGFGPAGCTTVQPLYGSIGTPGHSPAAEQLRLVDIKAGGRVGQRIKNELAFGFYGGEGAPDRITYRLTVQVADNSIPVDTARYSDLPAAYLQQLSVSFTLVDIKTQKTVLTGTSFANAAYDISNQRYANIRAARDAEDRAAVVIAADVRTKLAAFFAKGN